MECKDFRCCVKNLIQSIKIYPEWNVKIREFIKRQLEYDIKIYPEWNVKEPGGLRHKQMRLLKSNQNGM